ncbi:hypothetical protein [Streptomyces iranensis]|uniref:Uncharacterized protein n=1 Tax=Streptomyces iranensis TaxID=576784 RepID=A0A061A4S4_9ACTN|nr:hypothetical protein [Streptomyces iranensis]MBP2059603.1 hypothetical protein [Streptomyces iranensis]CDR10442.1 predicted protein [Streptomyces iranensis]
MVDDRPATSYHPSEAWVLTAAEGAEWLKGAFVRLGKRSMMFGRGSPSTATASWRSSIGGQQGDIVEASAIARISSFNRSPRITKRIADLRTALTPWQRNRAVRKLDDLLAHYRLTGSSSTNKS